VLIPKSDRPLAGSKSHALFARALLPYREQIRTLASCTSSGPVVTLENPSKTCTNIRTPPTYGTVLQVLLCFDEHRSSLHLQRTARFPHVSKPRAQGAPRSGADGLLHLRGPRDSARQGTGRRRARRARPTARTGAINRGACTDVHCAQRKEGEKNRHRPWGVHVATRRDRATGDRSRPAAASPSRALFGLSEKKNMKTFSCIWYSQTHEN